MEASRTSCETFPIRSSFRRSLHEMPRPSRPRTASADEDDRAATARRSPILAEVVDSGFRQDRVVSVHAVVDRLGHQPEIDVLELAPGLAARGVGPDARPGGVYLGFAGEQV